MSYGYRVIEVKTPNNKVCQFIHMGNDKLTPSEANDLALFMNKCCYETADAYIKECPEDMSIFDWFNATIARIVRFVEV